MSTSPEASVRADDRIVTVISRWLARHVTDEELRREIERVPRGELSAEQADAVAELLAELDGGSARADVEMFARETLEALALGG
jgi:hypothetical protein